MAQLPADNRNLATMHRGRSYSVEKKPIGAAGTAGTAGTVGTAGTAGAGDRESFRHTMRALVRSNSFTFKSLSTSNSLSSMLSGRASLGGEKSSSASNVSRAGKSRMRMTDETKVLLKMHIIQEKALTVRPLMADLRKVTELCQDAENNEEPLEKFLAKVLEIDSGLKLLRKLMLFLCRHRIFEKHFGVLSTIHERMKATMDISVQFFGVDWDHLESVMENMIQVIAEMIRILRQPQSATTENSQIELLLPSHILRDLTTLELDVGLHADAVLRGRLSQRQRDAISFEQKRYEKQRHNSLKLQRALSQAEHHEDPGAAQASQHTHPTKRWRNFAAAIARPRRRRSLSTSSNDELWRMWFSGIQTLTKSVSSMATTSFRLGGDDDSDDGASARSCRNGDDENEDEVFLSALGAAAPSELEEKSLLCFYTKHYCEYKPAFGKVLERVDEDDDCLELLQVVQAPVQKIDESEL